MNKSRAPAAPDERVALTGTIRMRLQLMLLERPTLGGQELLEELLRHLESVHGRAIDADLVGRAIEEELAARRERASAMAEGPTRLRDIA